MRTQFAKLLKLLRKTLPGADTSLVRRAYSEADRAHQGQVRLSGDPYIEHCIAVARILASAGLDTTTIAAALLHDVIEDTPMKREQLVDSFGEEIASLVDGVTKIGTLHLHATAASRAEKQAENLRKMLVATAKDVRVILIKLADRLNNMRTIEFLPEDRIRHISRETLDIYAPLANRLGICEWRWELEDHAFHRLNPDEYKEMARRVAMQRREREAELAEISQFIADNLRDAGVIAKVQARPKHLYSIYHKMVKQGIDFDSVMDLQGVRIVTQTEAECYNALGIAHSLWTPVPGRFKDYIAMPKANHYQSIHTIVMRENGKPLEIQIRTEEMDRTAQHGIAAHWRYKEGPTHDAEADLRLNWLRQMFEWIKETHDSEELLDTVRRDFKVSEIYVFTPKGEVKELPAGATPLDFAYMVHSDIGNHCIGAHVNGKIVPFRYNLQTGDMVEILTSKTQTPHQDWIDIVVTGRARSRVRQKLREMGELDALDQIKPKVKPPQARPAPVLPVKTVIRHVDDATREKLLLVEGEHGTAAQFGKCCNPMPGQPILGYVTQDTGITIHAANCSHFAGTKRDPKRIVSAGWAGEGQFEINLRVMLEARPNVLADLMNATRPMNIEITHADYATGENGASQFDFAFHSADRGIAERLARTLKTVAGVREVRTVAVRDLATAT